MEFGVFEEEKESVIEMLVRSGWRIDETGCVGEEPDDIGEIAALYGEIVGEGIRASTGGLEGYHEEEPGVCLTLDGEDPAEWWNPNIFWMPRPTRLTVDACALDPELFGPDLNSLLEDGTVCSAYDAEADLTIPAEHTLANSLRFTRNFRYLAAVPPEAIVGADEFEVPRWWKVGGDR